MTARSVSSKCTIENCMGDVWGKGWCCSHYELWRKYGSPLIRRRPAKNASLIERFWGRVALTADDSRCWEWTGETRNGYGIFNFKKVCYRAHRYAWFLVKGEHPRAGMFLCHKCDNRKCVNPNHLYEGTNQDNIRDRVMRGGVPQKQKIPLNVYEQLQDEIHKSTHELSQKYGFSQHIIRQVRNGTHWTNRVYA